MTNSEPDRTLERLRALEDRVNYADWSQPVLSAGEPQMIQVDTLDGLDPSTRKFFDVAVRGTPDVTYKSLRDTDGEWSWRLLSTGRFPFSEQGRDEGATVETEDGHFTQSVTEWATILDSTLSNPLPEKAFGLFTFGLIIETVAPVGTGQKQIRLVFNDTTFGTTNLGTGAAGYFAMFVVGPVAPWVGLRSVEGVNALWSSVATTVEVGAVNRIRVQARTQDEQNGQDSISGANLIVYS